MKQLTNLEKLHITIGYARNKLDQFLFHQKPIDDITKELLTLLNAKYEKSLLIETDLLEVKNKLNATFKKLIYLPAELTKKFERVLRDIVLSVENYATYSHLSDTKIEKPPTPYLQYTNKKDIEIINKMVTNCKKLSIVYMSLDLFSKYGHAALKIGQQGYVQINELRGKPEFYTPEQWKYFMQRPGYSFFGAKLSHKFFNRNLLGIQELEIPNLQAAKEKLLELASKNWVWNMFDHNCSHFVAEIMKAGGANIDNFKKSNLPAEQIAYVPLRRLIS